MKTVKLTRQAEADIGRLDPDTARRIFRAVDRFARTGSGNVQRLHGTGEEYRLRVGDWRVRFVFEDPDAIRILRVRHRSEAYR